MSSQDQTTANQGTGRNDSLASRRIFETAESLPAISRFVEALRQAQMDNDLLMAEWRTLFAPTNEALDAAPNDFWNELMKPENNETTSCNCCPSHRAGPADARRPEDYSYCQVARRRTGGGLGGGT